MPLWRDHYVQGSQSTKACTNVAYESHEVKKLVVELLERYAASTSNSVDDLIVATVRKALLGDEEHAE